MRKYINSLHLSLSDLWLLGIIIPGVFEIIWATDAIPLHSVLNLSVPYWLMIVLLVVILISGFTFIFLEYKKGRRPIKRIEYVFIFLVIINLIITLCQPNTIINYVEVKQWNRTYPDKFHEIMEVVTETDVASKIFFSGIFAGYLLVIYILLFVIPKRSESTIFTSTIAYIMVGVVALLTILSLCLEMGNYINFIKTLFSKDFDYNVLENYGAKSILTHRNVFGLMLLMGILYSFLNYSINKKKFNFVLAGIFYIEMWFTFCKTGLLLSTAGILIYIYVKLYFHFKNNKTAHIIMLSILGLIIVVPTIFAFVSERFRELVSDLTLGGQTLLARRLIWENVIDYLKPAWWLVGRGFGLLNVVLKDMNFISHEESTYNPHSWFFSALGSGGIIMVIAYLAMLIYGYYASIKVFRKDKELGFVFLLSLTTFSLYSLIEAFYHSVTFYVFIILSAHHFYYKKTKE